MKKGVDYIGVGSGAIIFNDEGKVFISQRGPKSNNERGKWEFPGGSVEFFETCENAIIREAKEEFNMDIKIVDLLEVSNHLIPEEKQHWVAPSYIAKLVGGELKNMEPEKCSGFRWVYLSEIDPEELSIVSKSNYDKYIERYGINKTF